MRYKVLSLLGVGILVFVISSAPFAYGSVPALSLSDGSTSLVVTDNAVGDSLASVGGVLYTGALGANWNVTVSGLSKPIVGSAASPVMSLSISATSSGAGTLTIRWSDNFFGPTSAAVTDQTGSTLIGTASYATYADSANGLFAQTTLLTSQGPFGPGATNNTVLGSLSLGSPYSLTLDAVLSHTDSGTSSLNETVVIPEPCTWALITIGLVGALLVRRRGRTE